MIQAQPCPSFVSIGPRTTGSNDEPPDYMSGGLLRTHIPPHVQGDLLLMLLVASDTASWSAPSGWTLAATGAVGVSDYPIVYNGVYWAPMQYVNGTYGVLWQIADSDQSGTISGPDFPMTAHDDDTDPQRIPIGKSQVISFRHDDSGSGEFIPWPDTPVVIGGPTRYNGEQIAADFNNLVWRNPVYPSVSIGYPGNHMFLTVAFVHGADYNGGRPDLSGPGFRAENVYPNQDLGYGQFIGHEGAGFSAWRTVPGNPEWGTEYFIDSYTPSGTIWQGHSRASHKLAHVLDPHEPVYHFFNQVAMMTIGIAGTFANHECEETHNYWGIDASTPF